MIARTNGGAVGGFDNPLIATTDAEMATYLADVTKLGMFVKFTGATGVYVQNEIYRIETGGDATQYIPLQGSSPNDLGAFISGGFYDLLDDYFIEQLMTGNYIIKGENNG